MNVTMESQAWEEERNTTSSGIKEGEYLSWRKAMAAWISSTQRSWSKVELNLRSRRARGPRNADKHASSPSVSFPRNQEGAVPLPIEPHLPLGMVLFGSDAQAWEGRLGKGYV